MTFTIEDLTRLIAKHNFCALATQGPHGPHVAGVGYFADGLDLYIATSSKTVKVRNLRRSQYVAVQISVPWPLIPAPPRTIQFRGIAEVLPFDDPGAKAALERASFVMRWAMRRLIKNVDQNVWGENLWVRVRPTGRIETFMLGVPSTTIFRDESKALLHFEVPGASGRKEGPRRRSRGHHRSKKTG